MFIENSLIIFVDFEVKYIDRSVVFYQRNATGRDFHAQIGNVAVPGFKRSNLEWIRTSVTTISNANTQNTKEQMSTIDYILMTEIYTLLKYWISEL